MCHKSRVLGDVTYVTCIVPITAELYARLTKTMYNMCNYLYSIIINYMYYLY